jgi:hypothetical protein
MSENELKRKGVVARISIKFANLFPDASDLGAAERKRAESALRRFMEVPLAALLFKRVPAQWMDLTVEEARLGSLVVIIIITAIPGKAAALGAFPAAGVAAYKFITNYKTLKDNVKEFANDVQKGGAKLAKAATWIYDRATRRDR